jgi:hypothetical protein
MESTIETELKRLENLRGRYAETNQAIIAERNKIVQGNQQIGDARVAAVLDPEANPPKTVEAKVRRLEGEIKAAEEKLQKLMPEAAALSAAIVQLEASVIPKRHAARLERQAKTQEQYRSSAVRVLNAANELAAASEEARTLYNQAYSEYPQDEFSENQAIVRRYCGLAPIWDAGWVNSGNPTRRDFIVGQVWEWDRSLVDPTDPTAQYKAHQENHRRQQAEEFEAERRKRMNPPVTPPEDTPRRPRTVGEAMSGELVNQEQTVIRVRSSR